MNRYLIVFIFEFVFLSRLPNAHQSFSSRVQQADHRALITFTIRNNRLHQTEQILGFIRPEKGYPMVLRRYKFGPYSSLTFTYPAGTKVECIQDVDLRGRPSGVRLLTVLELRDQGRTLKLF